MSPLLPASSLWLASGFESLMKHNDALGGTSCQSQGKKDLFRHTFMNEPSSVSESEPSVVGRIAHKAAPLGTQPLQH